MNLSKFLEEIQRFKIVNQDINQSFTFIKNIDWKFIHINDDSDIDRFITIYGDLLVDISQNENYIPKLCEIVVRYLHVNPPTDKTVKNFKPFFFLIWYLYSNSPLISQDLESAISHLFPHYLSGSLESITGYVENILQLVSLHQYDETNPLNKYEGCNADFINGMQYFVLSELVVYINEFDSRLGLKALKEHEVNKSPEYEIKIQKLDRIMCTFYHFIKNYSHDSNGNFVWAKAEDLLKKMKRIYRAKILQLNLPNSLLHVHYVLAFVTNLHPSLSKHICEYFLTIATDEDQSEKTRIDTIRSITGYVAKFNFIKAGLVINLINEMFVWCDRYLEKNDFEEKDIEKHGIFYSMANGAIFILFHRHKEIIEYFPDIKDLSGFAEAWMISHLTSHPSNVLREYPYREHFTLLSRLFRVSYMAFIFNVLEERNMARKPPPKLLIGMPFRYNFLPELREIMSQFRVSAETHPYLLW